MGNDELRAHGGAERPPDHSVSVHSVIDFALNP
jgi:hypothetical protein